MRILAVLHAHLLACLLACAGGSDDCPAVADKNIGKLHRLGITRFYIWHDINRKNDKKMFRSWAESFQQCKSVGMKVAKVNKLTTFAAIGVPLGQLVNKHGLRGTWYWLRAVHSVQEEQYRWYNGERDPSNEYLEYSNFFYQQPRPTGVGAYWGGKNTSYDEKNVLQCLTLSLPLKGISENPMGVYGNSASFDENPCEARTRYHAMCEADCKEPDPGPYVLSEEKQPYFDEGNWIIGDRKYVVNWAQRNKEKSEEYCQSLGLQLYSPHEHDVCLIPHIKLWARNVTMSHFWTNWVFLQEYKRFLDIDRIVRATYSHKVNWTSTEVVARSSKGDEEVCVSVVHTYEFRTQFPCPPNRINDTTTCLWHFLQYVPANCNNKVGTICQHSDYERRTCAWRKEYAKNTSQALIDTATLPFGYKGNDEYHRSTYKQTFGRMYCKPNYHLVRERNLQWTVVPSNVEVFKYDYAETYWVVDAEKFDKGPGSKCSISKVVNGARIIEKVPCTEWHFYLCKKHAGPPKPQAPITWPPYEFNDKETPRLPELEKQGS